MNYDDDNMWSHDTKPKLMCSQVNGKYTAITYTVTIY